MVIRITWGKLRAGAWNEFERTYRENVLTKGKGLKGLRGRWLAQDAADKDTGFAVSLWENLADMQAYEQGALYRRDHGAAPAVLRGRVQDLPLRGEVHRLRAERRGRAPEGGARSGWPGDAPAGTGRTAPQVARRCAARLALNASMASRSSTSMFVTENVASWSLAPHRSQNQASRSSSSGRRLRSMTSPQVSGGRIGQCGVPARQSITSPSRTVTSRGLPASMHRTVMSPLSW